MKLLAQFSDQGKIMTTTDNGGTKKLESQCPGQIPSKINAFLKVAAVAGTTPSLTMSLWYSYDDITYTAVPSGAMTAITAAGFRELNAVIAVGAARFYRWVATISGTNPSFTFDMNIWFSD